MNVSAKDKATNKDQSMTIASSSGLSDKDIEKMVSDAEQFAEADKARKAVIEESNKAVSFATDTEKHIKEFKEQLDSTEIESVTKLVEELKEIAAKGQAGDANVTAEAIKEKMDAAQDASLGLFQKVCIFSLRLIRSRVLRYFYHRSTRRRKPMLRRRSLSLQALRRRRKKRRIKFVLPIFVALHFSLSLLSRRHYFRIAASFPHLTPL